MWSYIKNYLLKNRKYIKLIYIVFLFKLECFNNIILKINLIIK
jgi:hypothetical protein